MESIGPLAVTANPRRRISERNPPAGHAVRLRAAHPTGKSLLIFRNRVKSQKQKYFCFRSTQIRCISIAVLSHQRGVAHVTNAGRDAVDAGSALDEWC